MIFLKNKFFFNYRLYLIPVFCVLASFFFTKPKFDEIYKNLTVKEAGLWKAIEYKSKDLSSNLEMFAPNTGEAKYVFRLTSPLLMKLFDFDRIQMFYLMVIAGVLTVFLWTQIIDKLTNNSKVNFLLTLALSTSYFGVAFYVDSGTSVNTFSFFLTLLSVRFVLSKYSFLFLAPLPFLFFNDERGAMAYGIVGLFLLFENSFKKVLPFKFFLTSKKFFALVAVFLACITTRLCLIYLFEMKNPMGSVSFNIFQGQWKHTQLGLFSGIEGFVIPLAFVCLMLIKKRKYIEFLVFFFVSILFLIGGLMLVSDMTKSVAFLVPISLLLLYFNNTQFIKYIAFSIVIVNIMFPTCVAVGPKLFQWHSMGYDFLWKLISII